MRAITSPRRLVETLVRVSVVALLAGLLHVAGTNPASATRSDGWVDVVVSNSPGYVTVAGWAWDPDAPATSIDVHFYVGQEIFVLRADKYRSDVGAHGFSDTIAVQGTGQLSWNAYSIDATGDGNWPLQGGTGTVPVNDAGPVGSVDSATSPAHRTVDLKGWASDPNAPASPVEIHVYIGGDVGTPGVELHKFMADLPRAGGGRGFSRTLVTSKGDAQTINVYALNVPGTPGANRLIKSFALTVYVDTTPPETTITSAPATATTADVIRVTFTANESNSTFECRWDQDAWLPCQSGTQVSLTPGKHQVSVRATDKYGNTELTPAVFLVTVTQAGPPPPTPAEPSGPTIAARAVKKKSKLRIDVAPDSATSNYRVVIKRKVGKKWRTVARVRTRGKRDVVVVNLRRGKYRVVLPTSSQGPAVTTGSVRLKR